MKRRHFHILIYLFALEAVPAGLLAQKIPVFRPTDDFSIQANDVALSQAFAGGMHSGQFFMFDTNVDGDEDLVVFDRAGDVVKVFTIENGQYTYQPDLSSFFPPGLENWIFLGDYNCDGQKDLFTYSSFGVRVFTNTSIAGEFPSWELSKDPLFTQSGNNSVNLLVNPSDIPSIQDIDGDGDIDILAFNFSSGETAELFENLSMDTEQICGLNFLRANPRWGNFSECNCGNYQFGDFSCFSPAERTLHIEGKSLLVTDLSGDGLPEALIGQESCSELTYLANNGTSGAPNFSERQLFLPNFAPLAATFFPSVFLIDADKDQNNDLVVSSNHREDLIGLDYTQSVFLLTNKGTNAAPDFSDPQPFLQPDMLDVGENAVPVAYDANSDGRPDILVANKGLPDADDKFRSTITLLQNNGNGSFTLITSDWMNLSNLGLTNLSFQLVDMDGDGRADLVLKGFGLNTFGLKLYWIPNKNGTFDPSDAQLLEISINATDYPFFYDVNGDRKLDILLGQSNGRLSLWLNSGSNIAPVFNTKTDAYLGLERTPDRTFLVPQVVNFDGNGTPDLLLADNSGGLRLLLDFTGQNPLVTEFQSYNAVLDQTNPLQAGRRLWPALADFNADNSNDMIIGTAQGGLLAFSSTDEQGNPGSEVKLQVTLYPNPLATTRELRISTNLNSSVALFNLSGQRLSNSFTLERNTEQTIDLTHLATGMYLLRVQSGSQAVTKRIIVGP